MMTMRKYKERLDKRSCQNYYYYGSIVLHVIIIVIVIMRKNKKGDRIKGLARITAIMSPLCCL